MWGEFGWIWEVGAGPSMLLYPLASITSKDRTGYTSGPINQILGIISGWCLPSPGL